MSGAAYRDRRGRVIELGDVLGEGGEGTVRAIRGSARRCAKIYLPAKAGERADKLAAMMDARPSWLVRRAIAWPVELLFTGDASFAGFVMPRERGMIELFRLLVPDERMAIAGFLTPRDLAAIAARIARLVAGVHRAGHAVGDLKPQNILVSPLTGRVALVDTDSFQIRDRAADRVHRCAVFTPEYTAPELLADPTRALRTEASDAFALAVLVHQILLGGAHPFDGELVSGSGSVERIPGRIRRGLCPIAPGVTAVRPAAGALSIATLHPGLRALFERTFGPGHAKPEERPSASAWHEALLVARGAMVRCRAIASHLHDRSLARCPWCERRERTGIDLFPAGQAWQRALARTPDPASAPERRRTRWLIHHARGRMRGQALTPAERAWLFKTGAALGFDRAFVTKTIAEAPLPPRARLGSKLFARLPRPRFSWPRPRIGARLLALSAVSMATLAAFAAGAFAITKPRPSAPEDTYQQTCAVPPRRAAIGNTRGQGAFLRALPSTTSPKLPLPEGTIVHLTGNTTTGDQLAWSEVALTPRGRTGWVATKYLVEPD